MKRGKRLIIENPVEQDSVRICSTPSRFFQMNLRRIPFLLVIAFAIFLSGCSSNGVRSQPLDTVWGRGLSVGTANMREPASIWVDSQDQYAHLVWAQKGDYGIDIHYALVDKEDGVQVNEQLQSGLFLPRSFRLFVTPQGQIHVLTRAKSNKDGISGVYHLQISQNGALIEQPMMITPHNQSVEVYDAVMLPDGQMSLIWESSREAGGGLYHRTLDFKDDAVGGIMEINAVGQGPSIILDQTGVLHLIWRQDDTDRGVREIYYDSFPNTEVAASDGSLITTHGRSKSASQSQPVIGYDDGHIYVSWHSEIVSGLEAGTGKTVFTTFPKGQPQQAITHDILIPDMAGEVTTSSTDELAYMRVSPEMAAFSSAYVIYPSPISANTSELLLLVSARTSYRMKEEMQPVMAVLVDGIQVGYAPIARTDYLSYFPVGVRNEQGNAYSVWLDYRGGGRYPVYLSSTSPGWKSGILQTKARDIAGDVSRELAFGFLTIVVLIPMTFLVLLLPFTWIIILLLLGRVQDLNTRGGRIQFGVAVVFFYVTKIAAFAPMLSSPSLLRTVSPPLAGILLFALPALIFFIAATAFMVYVRRADPPGLTSGFFLFAITDLFLTVLIYGPTLYT